MSTKRIIILGGGFGGVKCAETLRDLQNGAAVREDSLLEGSPPRRKSAIFRRIPLPPTLNSQRPVNVDEILQEIG
jgi:hypothetical protein